MTVGHITYYITYIFFICLLRLKYNNIVTCPRVATLLWAGHGMRKQIQLK